MPHPRLIAAAALSLVAVSLFAPASRLPVALVVLLVCPGYLLERRLLGGALLPPLTRPALWLGLSISAVALLYQWVTAAGLALTPAALGLLAALVLAGAALECGRGGSAPRPSGQDALVGAALLVVVGLTLWTRFAHIQGMAAPAWVDSLHHALLIRVAVERGQAPYGLVPYLPIDGLAYHSGYHVFVAAALRLAGLGAAFEPLALPEAMLLSGQALNGLVALAWGGAAAYLWRRPGAAVWAALVVGLASIMPAFYVSWGRYTLVAGVLVLPGALVAAHLALGRGGRGAVAVAAVLLAGLSLIHFVALWLALLWCGAAGAVALARGGAVRGVAGRLAALGGASLALAGPWLALLAGQARPAAGSSAVNVAGNAWYNAMPEGLLWAGNNRLLVALAGAVALLAVWRRRHMAATLLIWWALAALAANPVLVGLPYLSFFTNEFLAITLFAPLCLLIAGGVTVLEDLVRATALPRGSSRRYEAAQVAAALLLAVWLAAGFQSVVRPDTLLATAADLRAIAWAARETPPDARFVVNTAGWLGDVDRGADGGWWLLPLAGRQVSTPPVVFNYGPEAYVRRVKDETSWLRGGAGAGPEALAVFMRERGFTHVFATARGASVDVARLRESPLFDELHRDDDVSIFRLRGGE